MTRNASAKSYAPAQCWSRILTRAETVWRESFDWQSRDLLEIRESITRHLVAALKLRLTGAGEKKIAARYTEDPAACQAYLEGRYHWSRYTRERIEKAITHFCHAIKLEPALRARVARCVALVESESHETYEQQ